jgi:chromosome segregation ATPase
VRAARREAEQAEAALTKANAGVTAVEKQKQEIEVRYSEAKEQARAAASEVKKHAQTVSGAERALAKARAALDGDSE